MSKKGAKIWSQEERYEIYDMSLTAPSYGKPCEDMA